MRRLRYQVATSSDGYIARPNGEFDWIIQDPDIDFNELFASFDTAVIGRRTFETMVPQNGGAMPGIDGFVYSTMLRPAAFTGSREPCCSSTPSSVDNESIRR